MRGANGFIRPAHLKCTGPAANHDAVLAWTLTCCRRARQAGLDFIVFGSGGARQLPPDFPREKADEQFVALLRRMGPLAGDHGVVIAIEQLRAAECNYLNRLGEAAAVVAAAGHPHIRLNADLYHMAVMGDTPADLAQHASLLAVVEIAEKEKRTAPGVAGDDFRPTSKPSAEPAIAAPSPSRASGNPPSSPPPSLLFANNPPNKFTPLFE